MQDQMVANAWRVLALLFLANLLNFFDRVLPVIVSEPIRHEWGLSDTQLGLIGTAFTVVYAIAGVPLGRWADSGSRKAIMGHGLVLWSLLTGATGLAWNYTSFLLVRLGVGIGEACYTPAATSLIGDLFPSDKRSRAIGIFMLGLPIGLALALFSTGAMVQAFGSWRAPFFIAVVPGLAVAALIFCIKEPHRGAAESWRPQGDPGHRPIRRILRIRTMWWIILAGVAANFSAAAANSFLVPMLQRYFGLPLGDAAMATGVMVGLTGLVGLTAGGWAADKIHQRAPSGRLVAGVVSLSLGAAATWCALALGPTEVGMFTAIFSIGWLLQYGFFVSAYPAIHDVVEPRLRGTAMALYFAVNYLLGGAAGPFVTGYVSDRYAEAAMASAKAQTMTEQFKGIGLHDAMYLVPASLLLSALALLLAAWSFRADAATMMQSAGAPPAAPDPI
ncbi:spinster family MFS transporter [Inquilinus sp. CA228]|uniref:spinster family MFS transporter n=1 Tax=Inquilinus sp. CA228 TaxID=3455609 RepID=UPI003F8D233F